MRYLSFLRNSALACCILLLVGCPSVPTIIGNDIDQKTAEASVQWQKNKQQLTKILHYQIKGSFGYISQQKSASARVLWQEFNVNNYNLLLTTPFGNKILEMTVLPDWVKITNDKGNEFVNNDAEQLLYQLTKLTIPLKQMRLWLLGLPGDNSRYILDEQYRLKQVILNRGNNEWLVNYKSYHTKFSPQLPKEIEIIQGNQKIKLKIDTWDLK